MNPPVPPFRPTASQRRIAQSLASEAANHFARMAGQAGDEAERRHLLHLAQIWRKVASQQAQCGRDAPARRGLALSAVAGER